MKLGHRRNYYENYLRIFSNHYYHQGEAGEVQDHSPLYASPTAYGYSKIGQQQQSRQQQQQQPADSSPAPAPHQVSSQLLLKGYMKDLLI